MLEHERVQYLEKVTLFEGLRGIPGALAALANGLDEKKFAQNATILREGETGSTLYLLVSGEAEVLKSTPEGDPFNVAILRSQEHPFFGEGGILDSESRSASIIARSECFCLILEREAFQRFAAENPQWALPVVYRIAQTVMRRFRKTNDDLLLLYRALIDEIRTG